MKHTHHVLFISIIQKIYCTIPISSLTDYDNSVLQDRVFSLKLNTPITARGFYHCFISSHIALLTIFEKSCRKSFCNFLIIPGFSGIPAAVPAPVSENPQICSEGRKHFIRKSAEACNKIHVEEGRRNGRCAKGAIVLPALKPNAGSSGCLPPIPFQRTAQMFMTPMTISRSRLTFFHEAWWKRIMFFPTASGSRTRNSCLSGKLLSAAGRDRTGQL